MSPTGATGGALWPAGRHSRAVSAERVPRWPVVRYAAVWLLAGCLAAAVVVVAVRGAAQTGSGGRPAGERAAAKPAGSCIIRRDTGRVTPSALRAMQPPTLGPPARPARPGVHTRPLRPRALVGALRRGLIVVQYRPSLRPEIVRRLRREFGTGSPPTVVTPDATGMRFAVAVTAWSRLLGCASAHGDALRAAQDFRRHHAGAGPEATP